MDTPLPVTGVRPRRHLPLALKLALTVFVAVLVPSYWAAYGPTNFLYFCDVAILMATAAVWLESPLLASMPAVGILLPQILWVIDFLGGLFGLHVVGMTAYMFDAEHNSLYIRALSLFHGWLPFLLVWLVYRLGYDRRAFGAWTVLAWVLMLVCYFFMPPPPAPKDNPDLPVNINYVYGTSDAGPQTWADPRLYLALMLVGLPVVLFLPTHLFFLKLFPSAQDRAKEASAALPA